MFSSMNSTMKPLSHASVCFISKTPDAEKTIGYIARVSNPNNQDNPKVEKLLEYCIKHGHWSVFEQATMTLEINTTRAIAAQILRHRSFTYQEFSQRYADTNLLSDKIPVPTLRRQDDKNRQNSIGDLDPEDIEKMNHIIEELFKDSQDVYAMLLKKGVAKECARFVLPLATPTRIYMTGSLRSWIHYIELRTGHGTQKEHMDLAMLCKDHFICNFPTISKALGWCEDDCECSDEQYWRDLQPCLKINP